MTMTALPPTCELPVFATCSPARQVRVICEDGSQAAEVSLSEPVLARVTSAPPVRVTICAATPRQRFTLTEDQNFVRLPLASGHFALIPYTPE